MRLIHTLITVSLLGLVTAAHAEPASHEGRMHRPMHHGMHAMKGDAGPFAGLSRIKGELKLSAAQDAKWAEAEAATKAARESLKQQREQMRSLMAAEKQQEILDLAKLDREMDAMRDQARAAHDVVRGKWLAAYESLTLEQKRTVSAHIKNKMARMEALRTKFKERAEQRQKHQRTQS
ncbi:Spy/CpxP family protein refolding chaperone [Chitinimonas prasina]|nr:Spy/CpxP family protein refolding chaperone [Chitinimonas prasina]